eukprot:1148089-Pelagomonas_calceolata.AAC.6
MLSPQKGSEAEQGAQATMYKARLVWQRARHSKAGWVLQAFEGLVRDQLLKVQRRFGLLRFS